MGITTQPRGKKGKPLPARGRYQEMRRPAARAPAAPTRPGYAVKASGFVDLASASYVLDTTGTITLIATIAQGVATTQRIGKKIALKSIQIRGDCRANSTAVYNDVAIIVVYDRRPTGSLPAITDVLVSASANALNNDANSGRFKILHRQDFKLIGSSTTPTAASAYDADAFIRLPNLPAVYKAVGDGAIADIEQGALYLVTVGNAAAGTAAASASLAFRTRFYDTSG